MLAVLVGVEGVVTEIWAAEEGKAVNEQRSRDKEDTGRSRPFLSLVADSPSTLSLHPATLTDRAIHPCLDLSGPERRVRPRLAHAAPSRAERKRKQRESKAGWRTFF